LSKGRVFAPVGTNLLRGRCQRQTNRDCDSHGQDRHGTNRFAEFLRQFHKRSSFLLASDAESLLVKVDIGLCWASSIRLKIDVSGICAACFQLHGITIQITIMAPLLFETTLLRMTVWIACFFHISIELYPFGHYHS
jgi:hypothetical protein